VALHALNRFSFLHRLEQVHVLVDGLARLSIRGVSVLQEIMETIIVLFVIGSETLLQRALLHLHVALLFKADFLRVPSLHKLMNELLLELVRQELQVLAELLMCHLLELRLRLLSEVLHVRLLLDEGLGWKSAILFRPLHLKVVLNFGVGGPHRAPWLSQAALRRSSLRIRLLRDAFKPIHDRRVRLANAMCVLGLQARVRVQRLDAASALSIAHVVPVGRLAERIFNESAALDVIDEGRVGLDTTLIRCLSHFV